MSHNLQFIPFHDPADRGWKEAAALYDAAFPAKEIRSGEEHRKALADPLFRADGIWRDGEFAGLLYYWKFNDWFYIEHLAVDPSMRGKNIGSEALGAFCRGKKVLLEIDPPEDEISIRRLHFYQRVGFVENPYLYLHPSFRRPFETHRLVLLSYPGPLGTNEARAFADFVRERVLRYSEHEKADLPRIDQAGEA